MRELSLALSFLVLGCASTGNAPQDDQGGIGNSLDGAGQGSGDLKMTGDMKTSGDLGPMVDLILPPDLKAPVDLTVSPDLTLPLKEWGIDCTKDIECMSQHCLGVLPGANKICVSTCTKAQDCTGLLNAFCEASSAVSLSGYCIPHHPMHCASCSSNSDCGILAERCIKTGGDTAATCKIDCALGGSEACPADYQCTSVQDINQKRMLCLPKNSLDCLDALGGFCDRVTTPQYCSRTNVAGSCNGQRACLNSGRYTSCSAMAPQYRSCGQQNPAGCTEAIDPNALTTLQNCGFCNNSCPGQNLTTCDAACKNKVCDITCRGEHYDVDKSSSNGCEVTDDNPGSPNHSSGTSIYLGEKYCNDDLSSTDFTGHLPTDARVHANPIVNNFNGSFGAAPDYWDVFGNGESGKWWPPTCYNDYDVYFSTSSGSNSNCYKLTFKTNKLTDTLTINGHTTNAVISGGSGSYGNYSTITFIIEKICSTGPENAKYSVSFHL